MDCIDPHAYSVIDSNILVLVSQVQRINIEGIDEIRTILHPGNHWHITLVKKLLKFSFQQT